MIPNLKTAWIIFFTSCVLAPTSLAAAFLSQISNVNVAVFSLLYGFGFVAAFTIVLSFFAVAYMVHEKSLDNKYDRHWANNVLHS